MRILPFEPRHAAAWRDLNTAWISRHFTLEAKDIAVLNDPVGEILDKGGYILMGEAGGGEVIGCVALMALPDGGFEVAKMTVSEAARGAGLGRALLQACIDKAQALGAPRLYLETNAGLGPAVSLYRAMGFVDLPARASPYARCNVWMERPI